MGPQVATGRPNEAQGPPQASQNEALEPPKIIKNSNLDTPRCQEVAPEASEVSLRPKISRKSSKIRSKFNRKMCSNLAQSNENFTASSFAKLHAKIQWPRRSGRSPLEYASIQMHSSLHVNAHRASGVWQVVHDAIEVLCRSGLSIYDPSKGPQTPIGPTWGNKGDGAFNRTRPIFVFFTRVEVGPSE